jgi:hypothetical protein
MSELTVSSIQGLNVRVSRIERAMLQGGAFQKLDEYDAEQLAEHNKNIVEVNRRGAEEQAAWDAASPQDRARMDHDKHVHALESNLAAAQAHLADQLARMQENGDRHLADLTARIESAKAADPMVPNLGANPAPVPVDRADRTRYDPISGVEQPTPPAGKFLFPAPSASGLTPTLVRDPVPLPPTLNPPLPPQPAPGAPIVERFPASPSTNPSMPVPPLPPSGQPAFVRTPPPTFERPADKPSDPYFGASVDKPWRETPVPSEEAPSDAGLSI